MTTTPNDGPEQAIIGSRHRYAGDRHRFLRGRVVTIVAVHRGADADRAQILRDDLAIGELRADDLVEVAPIIEDGGVSRPSFVTSDARPDELDSL